MLVNEYCREYRMRHKAKLREVSPNMNIKTLSAFEQGRSTNLGHLIAYTTFSKQIGDFDNFIDGLKEVLNNGI